MSESGQTRPSERFRCTSAQGPQAEFQAAQSGSVACKPSWLLVSDIAGDLTEQDLCWADVIMTGGMLNQQADTLEVIKLGQRHGKPVVVGGPDVTSSPHIYSSADFRVLGEAEGIIDEFVTAWDSGVKS